MKCVVTGATGFVGRHLCRRLAQRGDQLFACSRGGGRLDDGTQVAALDLAAAALPTSALAGAQVVFHLAGIAHRHAQDADYEAVNHLASVRLAQQAAAAGVRCFVFLSSVRAMGAPLSDLPRGESELVEAHDAYGRSKRRAECGLRQACADSAMSVVIVRPVLLHGVGVKGNLRTLARATLRGLPRPPAGGRRSMLAVEDLVSLLCLLADEPPAGVSTWLASGADYSTRELYDALRSAAGKGRGPGWLPRLGWRIAARLLDFAGAGDNTYTRLFGSELYSSASVRAATGWRPACTLEQAARQMLTETRQ